MHLPCIYQQSVSLLMSLSPILNFPYTEDDSISLTLGGSAPIATLPGLNVAAKVQPDWSWAESTQLQRFGCDVNSQFVPLFSLKRALTPLDKLKAVFRGDDLPLHIEEPYVCHRLYCPGTLNVVLSETGRMLNRLGIILIVMAKKILSSTL